MRPRLLALAALSAACSGGAAPPDSSPPSDAPFDSAAPPDATLPDGPPPGPGGACSTAIDLGDATEPLGFTTDIGGGVSTGASCSGGSTIAPELYFVVDAGATPVDLVVDVVVPDAAQRFDVVAYARSDCLDAKSELACADSGWGERLEVLAATGQIFLIVDGTDEFGGAASGDFTIFVTRRTIAGAGDACDPDGLSSRCGADLICTGGTCAATSPALACTGAPDLSADLADGLATVEATVLLADPDYYSASCAFDVTGHAPERIYRFVLGAPRSVTASTDFPETSYDTNLVLRAGACDAAELACSDDVDASSGEYRTSLSAPALPAGAYYLFVDMSSTWLYGPAATPRHFRLQITAAP